MSTPLVGLVARSLLRRLFLAGGLVTSLLLLSTFVGSAQAASANLTTRCGTVSVSQPFTQWGDSGYYSLMPGGDFESGLTGWTLTGGAAAVAGSEPYAAAGSLGSLSLSLPAGASAQTPFVCVDDSDTDFRFFALNQTPNAAVVVSVVYTIAGNQLAFPVGVATGDSAWTPSSAMRTGSMLAARLSPARTAMVAIRFTAFRGTSQIDDLFLDPRLKY